MTEMTMRTRGTRRHARAVRRSCRAPSRSVLGAGAVVLALAWLQAAAPAAVAGQTGGQLFTPTHDCGSPAGVLITALATSDPYTVSAPGVITSWSFQHNAVAVAGLKLKVGRSSDGVNYTITGESTAGPQTPNAIDTYPARISVASGDRVGLVVGGGGCASLTMDAGDTVVGVAIDVLPNTTAAFSLIQSGLKFPVAAYVEPDADADGFGDETQDQCLGDPNTHGPCTSTPPPPPPPPPHDTTPPALSSSPTNVRPSRAGLISFYVTSDENATGRATATVSVPGAARLIRFAARRVTLAARVPTRVTLSLSKKNAASLRRALSTGRALTARVTVAVQDAAGNVSSRKLALRLRSVPRRSRHGTIVSPATPQQRHRQKQR